MDLFGLTPRAGPGQAPGKPIEIGLVTRAQALDHGALLLRACLGVAVQADFSAVLADLPVQMRRLPRGRVDGLGGLGVELAPALATDDQITVAGLPQPGDPRLGGEAPVHDHERIGRRAQTVQHALQRGVLAHVAGARPRAAHEARAVQHQTQREQRTVVALRLGMPVPRQRSKWRPRFNSVRCRTLSPRRSPRTSRQVL